MSSSEIEWTDETWNPTTGCSRVSRGCDNCYAMMMARRFDGMGHGYDGTTRQTERGTDWTGVVHHHDDRLDEPLSWRKPRLVFVDSMSDLYHPAVRRDFIDKVFAAMIIAEKHHFQILTKRPDRMNAYMNAGETELKERWETAARERFSQVLDPEFPPENVWLGTSVENSKVTHRVDELRKAPAEVRFLSCEPLLGPLSDLDLTGIDWVIVGGESGHGARPMKKEWATEIRDKCREAEVPFFFKQWGGQHSKVGGRQLEGEVWSQMPVSSE